MSADINELRLALYDASKIAHDLMVCAVEGTKPSGDLMERFGALQEEAMNAVLAAKEQRG